MADDYMNLAAIAVKAAAIPALAAMSKISVFPAQAGNQCRYGVQSSTHAQLDTRIREYDEVIGNLNNSAIATKISAIPRFAVFPKISVFPAQAGNQCHYEVQSSSDAQLDTRVREYDEIAREFKLTVFPAKAGNQSYYEGQSSLNEELDTRLREYDGVKTKQRTKQKTKQKTEQAESTQ